MGFICPEYNINKQLKFNITTFHEIPDVSNI